MTNSTTEPTQSIRERSIQSACMAARSNLRGPANHCDLCGFGPENQTPYCLQEGLYGMVLDAILSELMEPSEGMLAALCGNKGFGHWCAHDAAAWRLMIQHIRSGGK